MTAAAATAPAASELDYRPSFPPDRSLGIGIVGCGQIVRAAHLPAYRQYGLNVVGVHSRRRESAVAVAAQFSIPHVFESLDDLLADPDIRVVDIATWPDERLELIRRALAAGKHVLSQKPLAPLAAAAGPLVDEAERRGLRFAVNQNGRWAPPWRLATLLVRSGAIGDVTAVTHLLANDFSFVIGRRPDEIQHFLIYDYCAHWFDITRCWLEDKTPSFVRAREYRTPNQPAESRAAWGGWIDIAYDDGSNAVIRSVGGRGTSAPSAPFWIHGTEGTIRGSVVGLADPVAGEWVELEREGVCSRFTLEGSWALDGFAGAMAELVTAIAEEREPYNSARHNLLSLQLTLAACRSAEEDGRPVSPDEVR